MDIGIKDANRIIDHAFKRSHEIKSRPLGVVVVDTSGNIVSAQRDDGASLLRPTIAVSKAWGAIGMGESSRHLGNRLKELPAFLGHAGCIQIVPVTDGHRGGAFGHNRAGNPGFLSVHVDPF